MAESITLEIPEEVAARAREAAERSGRALEAVLTEWLERGAEAEPTAGEDELPDLLAQARAELGDNPPRTGAEIVAYWQREGLLGTRPDITDSLEYARALRRRAERRDWS